MAELTLQLAITRAVEASMSAGLGSPASIHIALEPPMALKRHGAVGGSLQALSFWWRQFGQGPAINRVVVPGCWRVQAGIGSAPS